MSKNIDIDGGTKTCETERFELLKCWPADRDFLLLKDVLVWIFHSVVTPWPPHEKQKRRAKLRTTRTVAVCVTRQSHEPSFEMGCRRELLTLRSSGKSWVKHVFVPGSVVDLFQNGRRRRSCSWWTTFEGDLRLVRLHWRTQHSSKVANEPPSKNQPAFFFSFCFLPPRFLTNESKANEFDRRYFATLEL